MSETETSSSTRLLRCLYVCAILVIIGCTQRVAQAEPARPVLISQANSTRAIAFEATIFTPEPFSVTSSSPIYDADRRTRVMLFARNLLLQPGEDLSVITADAEDAMGRHYSLKVEYVGPVPGQEWISQITLRLNDNLGNAGDVLVGISYRGVVSNRVRLGIGHTGGGPPDDEPLRVLEYDGAPQNVDFGPFWQAEVDLPKFFWEFWAMPGENAYARYLLSDGYGGAHALLFGFFDAGDPQRYSLYGNIYNGTSITTFNSDDGPAPGEWAHLAIGWDGRYIITYYDGVPVGRTAFAGPRRTPGPAGGGGRLYIGGSDHNNLIGKIAQVRGYEGLNPLEEVSGNRRSTSAFAPETFFTLTGNGSSRASFLINFFHPGRTVTDSASSRVGVLRGGTDIFFGSTPPPLSRFIVDPTAPNAPSFGAPAVVVDKPRSAPAGARIFDSFSRRSSTFAFNGTGGLGSTEGGSEGPQVWRFGGPNEKFYGPTIFGILNGRAVTLSGGPGIAWVTSGSTTGNLEVRVDRRGQASSGVQTGLCFRVKDGSNFFFAYTGDSETDPFNTSTFNLGYFDNGARVTLAKGLPIPNGWTTLRVVTSNTGHIVVYVDDTGIYSVKIDALKDETGAGLYNDLNGLALTNRWDNFRVQDAP